MYLLCEKWENIDISKLDIGLYGLVIIGNDTVQGYIKISKTEKDFIIESIEYRSKRLRSVREDKTYMDYFKRLNKENWGGYTASLMSLEL